MDRCVSTPLVRNNIALSERPYNSERVKNGRKMPVSMALQQCRSHGTTGRPVVSETGSNQFPKRSRFHTAPEVARSAKVVKLYL